jgi:hypothetical protein
MNAQPKPRDSHSRERIIAVPPLAAGAGLRLLLKTGLLPAEIQSLRFACDLDGDKEPRVKVVVGVGRTRKSLPCELPSEVRGALEQCFRRFLIRSRRVPVGTSVDLWEWSSGRDVLIYRRQRGQAYHRDPDG